MNVPNSRCGMRAERELSHDVSFVVSDSRDTFALTMLLERKSIFTLAPERSTYSNRKADTRKGLPGKRRSFSFKELGAPLVVMKKSMS